MKRYILVILFLSGALLTATAQEPATETVSSSNVANCDEYKNGYFIIKDGLLGKKYAIKRNGNRQVETDADGTKFIFDVNWVDDCTYTLELRKIVRNPNNVDWLEGQVITVTIMETTKDGYIQKSSSNIDELTFERNVVEVDHSTYKKTLRFPEDADEDLSMID